MIPSLLSMPSEIQMPLICLIRMWICRIFKAIASGRRNASGDTSPLIIMLQIKSPLLFKNSCTYLLPLNWGFGTVFQLHVALKIL